MPEGVASLAGSQAAAENVGPLLKDAGNTPRQNGSGESGMPLGRTCRRKAKPQQPSPPSLRVVTQARKHPEVFCDRPGCYEAVRGSSCAPASYCGDDCRTAMNRVRNRERKWLLRNRPAGRIKRHLEYQAARARRSRAHVLLSVSAAAPSSQPSQPLPSAVVNSGSVNSSRLDFKDSREMNRHDSQTDSCFRPRAPPADGRLVVD